MTANYCILKVEGGEELIGRYINDDEHNYYIDDVMKCEMNQTHAGTIVAVSRWMPFSDDKIIAIKKDKVITLSKARTSMIDYYEECVSKYYRYINKAVDEEMAQDEDEYKSDEYEAFVELHTSNTSVH